MRHYIYERKSWIAGFFVILLLADVLFWLDPGIELQTNSVVYFNGLLLILFTVFLVWRYVRETAVLKEMEEAAQNHDVIKWKTIIPEPAFHSEERWLQLIEEATAAVREASEEHHQQHTLKSADIEAWVHEMKTPLTAMKLLIDAHPDDPSLQKVEREWIRLHFLLEQQLYQSRLTSIEHDSVMEQTTIADLIFPEIKSFSSICRARGIGFDVTGEESELLTDLKWGRFVFRQLLSNAIKYSPDHSEIQIRADQNDRGVSLTIIDQGEGIKPEFLPRIYEKGFTGEAGRRQSQATGLGLYLAKQAADAFNIKLSILPAERGGTAAIITFPEPDAFQQPLHDKNVT